MYERTYEPIVQRFFGNDVGSTLSRQSAKKRVGGSPAGTDPGIEVITVSGILKYNQPDTVK